MTVWIHPSQEAIQSVSESFYDIGICIIRTAQNLQLQLFTGSKTVPV